MTFASSLDRYITGNYGEDQYIGEMEWEAFCDRVFKICVFKSSCPFADQCDETCAVVKAFQKDELDEQARLDDMMEEQWQREHDCLDCPHIECVMGEYVCNASNPGEGEYCRETCLTVSQENHDKFIQRMTA